jgi:plastocyanin
MFKPLTDKDGAIDALILRRYKPPTKKNQSDAWTVPDDRKVNPWDLNEPDPTDKGTMGTIPGPVIECNVGDKVIVHFRNLDMRTKSVTKTVTTTKTIHTTCKETEDFPEGVPCLSDMGGGGMGGNGGTMKATVDVLDSSFSPQVINVASGAQVTFNFKTAPHTVATTSHTNADAITITKDPNGDPSQISQAIPAGQTRTVTIQGSSGGKINYECGIHKFTGTINIT